jgi:1,4-dihydroxy-2-naphthoate octaprenyltransferase
MIGALIQAARLRTLPLSICVVGLGDSIARMSESYRGDISIWVFVTAVLLQISSNYANDYGDFMKGTDQLAERKDRVLSAGLLKAKQMRIAIIAIVLLTLASGITLLMRSFNQGIGNWFWIMLIIGIAAIAAAVFYTVGKHAFGYKALGEVFVFIFFGPVAVIGTVFLHHPYTFDVVWTDYSPLISASIAAGFACSSVLHINNMRDMKKDKESGKMTIAIHLGPKNALRFYIFLVASMCVSYLLFAYTLPITWPYLLLIALLLLLVFGLRVAQMITKSQVNASFYNNELRLFSLSTILLPILSWLYFIS